MQMKTKVYKVTNRRHSIVAKFYALDHGDAYARELSISKPPGVADAGYFLVTYWGKSYRRWQNGETI